MGAFPRGRAAGGGIPSRARCGAPGRGCDAGRYEKWQADQWPGVTSRSSGSSREQMSCAM